MLKWFSWVVLARVTGSPVISLVALLALWWVVDHFTIRLLPSPLRTFGRWRRAGRLRRSLAHNPHDRRAKLELADLLVEQRRCRAAVEVLRPNIEAGDDDVFTLFVMGRACAGAGYAKQAEVFLGEARKADPQYRIGQIDLELGKMRLANRDAAGAKVALGEFLAQRTSSVEGRYLLSQALAMLGDREGAEKARTEAWQNYISAPRFQRRTERLWAWRVKPWRPVLYLAAILFVVLVLFTKS